MHTTTDAPSDPIMTLDVGRILDCSSERVRQLCAQGKLHPVRMPNGIRIFSRREVEALRAARAARKRAAQIEGGVAL